MAEIAGGTPIPILSRRQEEALPKHYVAVSGACAIVSKLASPDIHPVERARLRKRMGREIRHEAAILNHALSTGKTRGEHIGEDGLDRAPPRTPESESPRAGGQGPRPR
ncbi:MAG: hypothetical protein ING19_00730 [Azospirillum sp.]|nr:hypothetical protein [Azospirillum sp.]